MSIPKPSVGRVVHYVARGSADGVFPPACRAAIVTQAGAWVDVEKTRAHSFDRSEGRPIQTVEQWFYEDAVWLQVMNPTGTFTYGPMKHDAPGPEPHVADVDGQLCGGYVAPGSWHWPARVDEDTARSAARGQRSMDRR